jgi:membrane protease YdiL (CAAX protease family)
LTFALLFHWVGPSLLRHGSSWWRIFHMLLILPLAVLLIASVVGAAIDVHSTSCGSLARRLRLSAPSATAWIWAAALSGFMYGGNWEDLVAVAASWLALLKENNRQVWLFAAILIGTVVKRSAGILRPTLQSIRFFNASGFYHEFFDRFGPKDFMGIPLHGAWWILFYYAFVILVFNIGGEELWWRGYVLPRQELAFGRATWVIHGILWSIFHLFMQPTLWDTVRMAITGVALSFVAQRTKSTWPGILGHTSGNLAFFLSLVNGVVSP